MHHWLQAFFAITGNVQLLFPFDFGCGTSNAELTNLVCLVVTVNVLFPLRFDSDFVWWETSCFTDLHLFLCLVLRNLHSLFTFIGTCTSLLI